MHSPSFEYTKTPPPGWDILMEFSRAAMAPKRSHSERFTLARQTWELAARMPAEVGEACLYYGLGKTACAVGRVIAGSPQAFTNRVARKLTANHGLYSAKHAVDPRAGLYIRELFDYPDGKLLTNFLKRPTNAEYRQHPPAERLVANLLAQQRRLAVHREIKQKYQHPDVQTQNALWGSGAVRLVINESLTGAGNLLALAIARKVGVEGATADELTQVAIADSVTAEELTTLLPKPVALKAARLRIDEFDQMSQPGSRFSPTTDTSGTLDHKSIDIPARPDPISYDEEGRPNALHKNRFACPAFYVRGLIPLVTDLFPEAVNKSQAVLLANGPRRVLGRLGLFAS